MRTPADLLGSDNYFHWEFNMRMKLARKGLLAHIIHEAKEHETTDAWRVLDLKAFAIIAQGIEVEHQSKIRNATTAKQAWDILRDYYNKGNTQNRITLTRKLHEFKMEEGSSMSSHLDRFGELVVAMEAVGDRLDESRQLVILLGSLSAEYDTIVTVIENAHNVSLDEVKEKLLKQYDKLQQQEPAEGAFRARHRGGRYGRAYKNNNRREGNDEKKKDWRHNKFLVTCYGCGKRGHKKHECRSKQDVDETMFMAHATSEPEEDGSWLIDSGASSHMSPYRDDFVTYHNLSKPIEVKVADGKKVTAAGRGDVRMKFGGVQTTVTNVLHIPGLDRRLLSVPKLTDRGWMTQFTAKECSIMKGKRVVAQAPLIGSSYVLRGHQEKAMLVEYNETDSKWKLYHARHGHAGHEAYNNTQRATTGLPEIKKPSSQLCGGCAKGKMTVAMFPNESTTKTTRPLELVHTDLIGPMRTRSAGGSRYVLTFVDDYSKFVDVYSLKNKSQVYTKFIEYKRKMENICGTRILRIRSYNGGEYTSKRFKTLCRRLGIIHQKTVPYSPQQNGVAERMNRTLVEKGRCMLHYKGLRLKWWAEAVATAAYLINRTATSGMPDITPYEIIFKVKPDLAHLRVFGSMGYAHIDESKRGKLDPKSFKCRLLGYAVDTKGYKVLNLESGKVVVSRSVRLDEREVSGIYDEGDGAEWSNLRIPMMNEDDDDKIEASQDQGVQPNNTDIEMHEPMEDEHEDVQAVVPSSAPVAMPREPERAPMSDAMVFRPEPNRRASDRFQVGLPLNNENASTHQLTNGINDRDAYLRIDDRPHNPSNDSIVPYGLSGSDGDRGTKRARLSDDEGYEVALATSDTPTTYREAVTCDEKDEWIDAINTEFAAHERNRTWTKVKRQPWMKTTKTKWVFARKLNELGQILRWKARLVALGFLQRIRNEEFYVRHDKATMSVLVTRARSTRL